VEVDLPARSSKGPIKTPRVPRGLATGIQANCKCPVTTISGRGVILQGQSFVDVTLPLPPCPSGEEFLVQGVQVGPEVIIGRTMIDVVKLPHWAISVPVYQVNAGGRVQVALVAIGNGAQNISATIPAGQTAIWASSSQPNIICRIILLGGNNQLQTATARFEFNVHVWGCCGKPFVSPQ
jgi:hypothetical protein